MSPDDSLALLEAELSGEELKFVHHLVMSESWNMSDAARAAGFEGSKPAEFAVRLMQREPVRRAIQLIQADRRTRYRDVRDGAIQALWLMATHDIKDLARAGQLLPPDELPAGIRCAIKGVKYGKQGWEYQLVDRVAVLSLLMKHFEQTDNLEKEKSETAEGVTVVFETPRGDG